MLRQHPSLVVVIHDPLQDNVFVSLLLLLLPFLIGDISFATFFVGDIVTVAIFVGDM
jgi:hypothetical protein